MDISLALTSRFIAQSGDTPPMVRRGWLVGSKRESHVHTRARHSNMHRNSLFSSRDADTLRERYVRQSLFYTTSRGKTSSEKNKKRTESRAGGAEPRANQCIRRRRKFQVVRVRTCPPT